MDLVICNLTDTIGNKYIGIDVDSSLISNELEIWEDNVLDINQCIDMKLNKFTRDKGKFHITVINVMEFNKLIKNDETNREKLSKLLGKSVSIELLGIGAAIDEKKGNEAHFIVIDSSDLKEIRTDFELKNQDFHITLGFDEKDVFGKSKAKDSIFKKFDN